MPPFRFHIPFFSYGSPSRLSSGTSSPSPSPTPSPSRPPFRPAGIAQPSKPATSSETKSKVSSSLSRVKSNVAAMAASLSGSQSPSRGQATPTRLAKQRNQPSGSPVNRPESLRMEEEKALKESEKEAQEHRKKTELEKLALQEKKKVLRKDVEEKSEGAQEQQKSRDVQKLAVQEKEKSEEAHKQRKKREFEKLAVQESKTKVLPKDLGEKSEAAQEEEKKREVEKLTRQESKTKQVLPKDKAENSEAAPEQQKKREVAKLAIQESKTKIQGGQDKSEANVMQENREAAQGQDKLEEKEKLESQETKKALQATSAASQSTRELRDLPDTKTKPEDRREIQAGNNQRKTKVIGTHGNERVRDREGSSSMSRKIKEDVKDGISKLAWGKSNGDEKSVSVITLTGENRGATMAIDSEKDEKSGEVHIRRGYKTNPNESPNTTSTEIEEEKRNAKGKNPKDEEDEEKKVRAYVNGNTQGINNSIVLESSVRENDPGIHMSMRFEESHKEIINPPESVPEKKPEMVKNEPRVRRRCLRGLLAESSESESKPRRHGCRFTCKDKDIENT